MRSSKKKLKFRFKQDEFIKDVLDIRNSWGGVASQSYISDQTGISQATLSRIINGAVPKIPDFITLCNYMELSPDFYFDRVDSRGESE